MALREIDFLGQVVLSGSFMTIITENNEIFVFFTKRNETFAYLP